MRRAWCWGIIAASGMGFVPGAVRAQDVSAWAPGTYALWVCRSGPCRDSTDQRLVTRGVLVLGGSSELLTALPESLQRALSPRYARVKANGCFDVSPQPTGSESYAGIARQAGIVWTSVDSVGAISFQLYRSPDAAHDVLLHRVGDELIGRGDSRGAGSAAVAWSPDTVIARRIGPVDLARCAHAALRRLEYLRQLRRLG
ncbi:MAG: hypothetical protein K2X99_11975 [Gemmatimonadaceae bacterium]|nr:hypothetical protein [Gemmatimonadaceae bacterium]